MISAVYTMNLFNTSDTQRVWACENYKMKDRMIDLLDELSEHVDTTMVDKVADFIEEAVDYYKVNAEEYEREVQDRNCEIERLESEIDDLEKELKEVKEKTKKLVSGNDGEKNFELESKTFTNLTGYNKARKELLNQVKEIQGVSQEKRIYLPKGVIEMQVLVYGEVVESLRLSSKEFMNYIREHKTGGYKYRLRIRGSRKSGIDWKNS